MAFLHSFYVALERMKTVKRLQNRCDLHTNELNDGNGKDHWRRMSLNRSLVEGHPEFLPVSSTARLTVTATCNTCTCTSIAGMLLKAKKQPGNTDGLGLGKTIVAMSQGSSIQYVANSETHM
jgi:hypothetical protein